MVRFLLVNRKKSNIIWFFTQFALSLATPKILPLEKTQKIFDFLLAYSYLCNMLSSDCPLAAFFSKHSFCIIVLDGF